MTLDQNFRKAAEDVKQLIGTPTDDEKLELYALYKQSEVGDCNTDKPGLFDLKGKYKWEAWNAKKGIKPEEAKETYIVKANELIEKYGLKQ